MESYGEILCALAAELGGVAALSPRDAVVALGPLVDHASVGGVLARLRAARCVAAVQAVEVAGSQAELARELGLSGASVSRLVRGVRRRVQPLDAKLPHEVT